VVVVVVVVVSLLLFVLLLLVVVVLLVLGLILLTMFEFKSVVKLNFKSYWFLWPFVSCLHVVAKQRFVI